MLPVHIFGARAAGEAPLKYSIIQFTSNRISFGPKTLIKNALYDQPVGEHKVIYIE